MPCFTVFRRKEKRQRLFSHLRRSGVRLEVGDPGKVKHYIDGLRWMNGGQGPAVPQFVADDLKKMGITSGYVVSKPLPIMAKSRPANAT